MTEQRTPEEKVAKHTPGPWKAEEGPNMATWIGVVHPEYGFITHAEVRAGCDESAEIGTEEGNARLIVAAPDLLEKLDQLTLVIGMTAFKYEGQRAVLQQALDEARAVIAKAKGAA